MNRGPYVRAAAWIIPPALCLALYWPGLVVWFQQDDFAWLALGKGIHSERDFWRAMFWPMAQGTIRPWSERVFFVGFYALFGLDPLPFRLCAFLTQFANLWLVAAIARRLTGSEWAGLWAPVLWIANWTLITIMTWSSAYNQALCAFFLLLAFYFLLEGRWVAQWVTYLFGFGALEINVVYPAIATGYALVWDRRLVKRTLPLWIPAIAFAVVHRMVAPKQVSGVYVMHFDGSMLGTLGKYWDLVLGPSELATITELPAWAAPVATALLVAGLAGFTVAKLRLKDWRPLFFLGWFVVTLAPVLPLRDHVSFYYLTAPSIGLAMLGGWAVASARTLPLRAEALVLLVVYAETSGRVAVKATRWYHARSKRIERMVAGVARARELHPDKTILLAGVDDELFWTGILDNPFRLIGVSNVYLAPELERNIRQRPEIGRVQEYTLPAGPALDGLKKGSIVVYSVAGDRLRNVTQMYAATAPLQLKVEVPRRVDVGNPMLEYLLGKTWYPREGPYRWMPQRATVRIAGPSAGSERLWVTGYYPAAELAKGPVRLSVTADGRPLGVRAIERGMERFDFTFELPRELVGRESMELVIEVERTFRPSADGRELGAVFGVFEVR